MNQSFLKSMGFDDAILIDARFGNCPVAIAADIMGGKPKRQRPSKRWTWEDCQALAGILKVALGRTAILFKDGSSFEHDKRYGYRNASQCYEALLSLQRDRLDRRSDAEAIAAGRQAKEFFN